MQSNTSLSDHQIWMKFFRNALIPSQFASVYANKFSENRIRFDMLGDLSRELLQEMGINALGDCLSILKHAKTISEALEETAKKELSNTNNHTYDDSPHSNVMKKRCDLAKRLIGNFTTEAEASSKVTSEAKTLSRPILSTSNSLNGSSLSADLQSRLNFNNTNSSSSSTVQPVVKFNEDSLLSKVVVSSTTMDEDEDANSFRADRTKKTISLKRKLTGLDGDEDDDQNDDYRDTIKKRSSTSALTITTGSSPKLNPSVKSRLSLNLSSIAAASRINQPQPKTITLNNKKLNSGANFKITTIVNDMNERKNINNNNNTIPSDGLYSSRADEKVSVFERIKKSDASLASRLGPAKSKSLVGEANKAKIVKSLGGEGKRVENVTKSRVIPVSVTFSGRLNSDSVTSKPSVKDRLSFKR